MNLLYFETSAKTGTNIKTLFNELAKKITGIQTNPINQPEEKSAGGFQLEADRPADGSADAGQSAAAAEGKKKKGKKKSFC